jgi:hypothetical protein
MTRKPTSLSAVMAKKSAAATTEPSPSDGGGTIRTLTLRLKPIVHDQLREMAFTARRSQHDLLMEALNDLFQKHGKPPIAL